jgi:hypothetical protein
LHDSNKRIQVNSNAFSLPVRSEFRQGVFMLILKSRKEGKGLVLGDYVTVHAMDDAGDQSQPEAQRDNLTSHDEFFRRALKQRGLLKAKSNQRDIVMNVDNRQRSVLQNSLPRMRAG